MGGGGSHESGADPGRDSGSLGRDEGKECKRQSMSMGRTSGPLTAARVGFQMRVDEKEKASMTLQDCIRDAGEFCSTTATLSTDEGRFLAPSIRVTPAVEAGDIGSLRSGLAGDASMKGLRSGKCQGWNNGSDVDGVCR